MDLKYSTPYFLLEWKCTKQHLLSSFTRPSFVQEAQNAFLIGYGGYCCNCYRLFDHNHDVHHHCCCFCCLNSFHCYDSTFCKVFFSLKNESHQKQSETKWGCKYSQGTNEQAFYRQSASKYVANKQHKVKVKPPQEDSQCKYGCS